MRQSGAMGTMNSNQIEKIHVIVGMTTTCAAKLQIVLQQVKSSIGKHVLRILTKKFNE